jgi:malonate transporter
MITVLAALFPVFLLIVMGFVLRRWLIAEDQHWIGLERLLYYVMFPALLVGTMARADLSNVPVVAVGGTLFASVLLMAGLCFMLRPLLARRFGIDGPAFTSLFQGATRWQTFVALAVAGNLFGDRGLALASVAMVAMIPPLTVLSVWVLVHYASPSKPDWRAVLLALVQNPFIWACVAGLVLNPVAWAIPRPIDVFIDALGRSSLALGLLIVGAGLRPDELIRLKAATLIACVLKLVLMPAVGIGLGLLAGLSGASLTMVGCCTAVPTASNAYILARQMGGDAPLMAQIMTVQTVLAVITMPIAIALAS